MIFWIDEFMISSFTSYVKNGSEIDARYVRISSTYSLRFISKRNFLLFNSFLRFLSLKCFYNFLIKNIVDKTKIVFEFCLKYFLANFIK